jgi:hypothetical protein
VIKDEITFWRGAEETAGFLIQRCGIKTSHPGMTGTKKVITLHNEFDFNNVSGYAGLENQGAKKIKPQGRRPSDRDEKWASALS